MDWITSSCGKIKSTNVELVQTLVEINLPSHGLAQSQHNVAQIAGEMRASEHEIKLLQYAS